LSRRFSGSGDVHGIRSFTIVGALLELPGSLHALAEHVARLAVGVTAPAAVALGAALAARGRAGRLGGQTWAALGLSAVVIGEALLLNPGWLQGSQPRLAALGLPTLAAAAGMLLGRYESARGGPLGLT